MTIDWKRIHNRIQYGDCWLPLDTQCPYCDLDESNNPCWRCWGEYIEKLVLEEHSRNKPDLTWLGIKS